MKFIIYKTSDLFDSQKPPHPDSRMTEISGRRVWVIEIDSVERLVNEFASMAIHGICITPGDEYTGGLPKLELYDDWHEWMFERK